MAIAFGPCMLVAPLVFLVGLLLLPLWPVAIVVMAALWLIVWPLEQVLLLLRVRAVQGMSRRVGQWLKIVLRPWILFEIPPKKQTSADP